MTKVAYGPYFDPEFDSIVERVNPSVCIDNETCQKSTLIKWLEYGRFVDSIGIPAIYGQSLGRRTANGYGLSADSCGDASERVGCASRVHDDRPRGWKATVDSDNWHGILLEMVQLLTDLDLVISKSYISSDGGWLMDVFHVTDQLGNKLTDPTLIRYIQQSLVSGDGSRGIERRTEVRTCMGKLVGPGHLACEYTILEITATDSPGLLSEVSAVLVELDCLVVCAQAWTHNSRAAAIFYLVDRSTRKPISDHARLAHIKDQVDSVVEAHHDADERRTVTIAGPMPGRVHTERRLHQLMLEDKDYEVSSEPLRGNAFSSSSSSMSSPRSKIKTLASIDSLRDRGYSVVNIRSRDRPKLLFDTVCTLTDMNYSVFHATVGAHGPMALQEYYIRHMDGCTLDTDEERQRVIRCLVAAVERRISRGLKIDVSTKDRPGLLSDITRVLREHGLSLTRMECATRGERAVGTFYVTDASFGGDVDPRSLEAMREEIGENITVKVNNKCLEWAPAKKNFDVATSRSHAAAGRKDVERDRPKFSLGSLLWSHIERLSFGSIKS